MIWWIVIPAVVAAALAYAYWEHHRKSHHLEAMFTPLAAKYSGEVKAASLLALPQLHFERDGQQYFIGAMANAGARVSGSASRPGFNGPFTFANLELDFDTGQDLNVLRTDRLDRAAGRLVNSITGNNRATSGDENFDSAFRIRSDDQNFVHRVLDPDLRRKLLDSPQQRLELAVEGAKVSIHIDDYVNTAEDLEEMIQIATLAAKNCVVS